MALAVNNHEDEEDENSGHKIHDHLQQQDYDVQRGQGFAFVLVSDLYDGDGNSDEGQHYGECPVGYQLFNVAESKRQNIRKTVVDLKPELKISLKRGFDDDGKSD